MKKYQYKVFNLSEVSFVDEKGLYKKKYVNGQEVSLVDVLNNHGQEGWRVLFPLTTTKQSFLMIREIE